MFCPFDWKKMILYFDTETTGLRPGQICQISYIMQYPDRAVAKNAFFTVDYMDMGAFMVHGLSMEKLVVLSGGQRFADRIAEISSDFADADIIVSHNTAFDFMFMRAEFERLNKSFTYNKEFCSMKSMTPVCKLLRSSGAGYKYPKLSELCDYFGITPSEIILESKRIFGDTNGAHDSRYDTTAVYLAINKGIEIEPVMGFLTEYL